MSGGRAAIELNCRRPAAVAISLVHVCDHGEEIPLRYFREQTWKCFAGGSTSRSRALLRQIVSISQVAVSG